MPSLVAHEPTLPAVADVVEVLDLRLIRSSCVIPTDAAMLAGLEDASLL
jgi:hypothetical protein